MGKPTAPAEIEPDGEATLLSPAFLPPGKYTAIVRGAGRSSGLGLVEIYNLELR